MCITTNHQNTQGKPDRTEGEMGEYTIAFGNFNTPLLEMDRSSCQKINKSIIELSSMNQLDTI